MRLVFQEAKSSVLLLVVRGRVNDYLHQTS